MLDYKFIKENVEAVKQNIKNRHMNADADKAVELYDKRTALVTSLQNLQKDRNDNSQSMKQKLSPEERQKLVDQGKAIKEKIAQVEAELAEAEKALHEAVSKIPNMAHPEAPVGKEDSDNLEVKRCGTVPKFDFEPKDHVQLGQDLDLIDFEAGTKVSGVKFYFLKNEAVFLEQALTMYGLNILRKHGFKPFITPDVAKEEILYGIGFNPRGEESNVYSLEGEGTCLVATAEITLGGYHSDEIIKKESLPLKYCGLSHCFRREAGAAGQFSKGLYRVHQFSKLEMFVYCTPEESDALHEELRLIEEEIFNGLGIPFRVVDTCTGDLGAPAYRKWDLEAWMPGRNGGEWGEVTSTSNCTDYQARRLNIRYKDDDGKNKFLHTLNGTALAMSRAMIAVLENYQQADGSIKIPEALVSYCGFDRIG
ncbi:serine--tRNA ligase [Treponema denticola]|uniref:serine--tRNA ligase n=1 Tax=Treponema denticola TaxID=158 RepID=UPI00403787D2